MAERDVDGAALKNLRLQAGMTVEGLSARSIYIGKGGKEQHVSVSTLLSYEYGRRKKISETTLMGLAKGFGITIADLEKAIAPPAHVKAAQEPAEEAPDA